MKFILNVIAIIANVFNCLFSLLFSGMKFKTLVYTVSQGKKRKLDLYLPEENGQPFPVILYIHGGGWISGGKKIIEPGIIRQVKRGYVVASIRYSFTPWKKWPTQVHESKAAVRWLRSNAVKYNLNPDKILAWGVSAGGHLVNVLGCSSGSGKLEGTLSPEHISSDVQGVISWYGFSDFSQMGQNGFFDKFTNIVTSWLVGEDIHINSEKTRSANPINYLNEKTPPFYIMHGGRDTVVNIHQNELLNEALLQHGIKSTFVTIPNYYHADVRFNKGIHIKKIESFMDNIAFTNNQINQD